MLFQDLQIRENEGNPIRIGVSGAEWMGSGFVNQVARMKGMEVKLLADTNVEAARKVFLDMGIQKENIVEAYTVNQAADALRAKKYVISCLLQVEGCPYRSTTAFGPDPKEGPARG